MARPKKDRPLTSAERQAKHKERMNKFGVKRIYFKASESQRVLVERLQAATGCDNREELILRAITAYGLKHKITLKQINAELKAEREQTRS